MSRTLRPFLAFVFAAAIFVSAVSAQESSNPASPTPALQPATILSIEPHEEGRAFDWVRGGLTSIPIYDHRPFFDLTVALDNQTYVVRYEPPTGYYPSAWKSGSRVQARRAKGRVFLLRYDGEEVQTIILRKYPVHH